MRGGQAAMTRDVQEDKHSVSNINRMNPEIQLQ